MIMVLAKPLDVELLSGEQCKTLLIWQIDVLQKDLDMSQAKICCSMSIDRVVCKTVADREKPATNSNK